jgi:hypothetical protein
VFLLNYLFVYFSLCVLCTPCVQIKTPTIISSLDSNKPRRSSIVNLVLGAQKDRYLLQPSQLVLKQCNKTLTAVHTQTVVVDVALLLPPGESKLGEDSVATPQLAPDLISGLFGGPLLAVNVLNSREADALVAEKALARRAAAAEAVKAAPGGPGPGGGPAGSPRPPAAEDPTGVRVITDLDETEEAIRAQLPPAPGVQVTVFLTLVSARWVKKAVAQNAAAAAALLAQKEKDKGGKKGRKAAVNPFVAVTVEEGAEDAGDGGELQLIAVGPAMQTAETVRWDLERGLVAVKLVGSNVINILQMRVKEEAGGGSLHLHLQTLAAVDMGAPSSPLHRPFTAMHWARGVLFVTAPTAATVKAIVCYPAVEQGISADTLGLVALPASEQDAFVDTFDLDYFSPVSSCPPLPLPTPTFMSAYPVHSVSCRPSVPLQRRRRPRLFAQLQPTPAAQPRVCVRGRGRAGRSGGALHQGRDRAGTAAARLPGPRSGPAAPCSDGGPDGRYPTGCERGSALVARYVPQRTGALPARDAPSRTVPARQAARDAALRGRGGRCGSARHGDPLRNTERKLNTIKSLKGALTYISSIFFNFYILLSTYSTLTKLNTAHSLLTYLIASGIWSRSHQ